MKAMRQVQAVAWKSIAARPRLGGGEWQQLPTAPCTMEDANRFKAQGRAMTRTIDEKNLTVFQVARKERS